MSARSDATQRLKKPGSSLFENSNSIKQAVEDVRNRITYVNPCCIEDFINPFTGEPQPFDSEIDDEFIHSIKEYGVEVPITVRPKGEGYEALGGHRRRNGAIAAGVQEVPIILEAIHAEGDTIPTQEQAAAIKKLYNEAHDAGEKPEFLAIIKIMQVPKPNQKETVSIPPEGSFLSKYYRPGTPPKQIIFDIEQGLKLLQRERARQQGAR